MSSQLLLHPNDSSLHLDFFLWKSQIIVKIRRNGARIPVSTAKNLGEIRGFKSVGRKSGEYWLKMGRYPNKIRSVMHVHRHVIQDIPFSL